MRWGIRLVVLTFVAIVAGAGGFSSTAALAIAPVELAPIQEASTRIAFQPERGIRRARLAGVDVSGLPRTIEDVQAGRGSLVRLDLFPDVSLVAEFERFDPSSRGVIWVGRLVGQPDSRVTLVYADGQLTAGISTATGGFSIRPVDPASVPAGVVSGSPHTVTEADQSTMRPESEPIEVAVPAATSTQQDPVIQADPANEIDLMVVYTPAATAWAGGASAIISRIELGVSETNSAYAGSGVTQRLRLVHTEAVDYTENSNSSTNLSNLRNGVGVLSGVAALRDTHAADLVMMVQSSTASSCGVAYVMTNPSTGFAPSAYSVVEVDCISPNYTFAHELGHNMGLQHDWYVSAATQPYTYAHGHVSTAAGNRWRTIMSYNDLCVATGGGCTRLLAFSNPDILRNGIPMGIPGGTNSSCTTGNVSANTCDAHEQRALDNTAPFVANFRDGQSVPGAFVKQSPANGVVVAASGVALGWTASTDATSYEYCVDTVHNSSCETSWMSSGTSLSAIAGPFTPGASYSWQVRALNSEGTTQADGGTWRSFKAGPSANTDFAANGSFSSGATGWQPYATPNNSYIVSNVTAGVFQFYRQPPPVGTSNQAVVLQQTNMPIHGGAPLLAQFSLGNSDNVRKRLSVLIHDFDFSDLAVCTFWLPANAPLASYAMRTHTTRDWANTTISFYAATEGSNGGFYRLDNVSIRYAPAQSAVRTDCVDALAPGTSGLPDSAELLTNGAFNGGSTSSWTVTGQIVSQVSGNVFEFYRPSATPDPAGLIFQSTGATAAAGDIFTARFDLGNSSSVRKRVTVLIHDLDFTDLGACTFWVPPGQALSPYAMRTYATKAWANATVSVYAATVGNDQWTRLDNVSLKKTPSSATSGADCVEPGGTLDSPQAASQVRLPARTADAATSVDAERLPSSAKGRDVQSGSVVEAPSAAGRVRIRVQPGTASPVHLQISFDRRHWSTIEVLPATDEWITLDIDLSEVPAAVAFIRVIREDRLLAAR